MRAVAGDTMPKMMNTVHWFDGVRAVRLDEVAYVEASSGPNHLTLSLSLTLRSGAQHKFVLDADAYTKFRAALRDVEDGPVAAAYRKGLADAL